MNATVTCLHKGLEQNDFCYCLKRDVNGSSSAVEQTPNVKQWVIYVLAHLAQGLIPHLSPV